MVGCGKLPNTYKLSKTPDTDCGAVWWCPVLSFEELMPSAKVWVSFIFSKTYADFKNSKDIFSGPGYLVSKAELRNANL